MGFHRPSGNRRNRGQNFTEASPRRRTFFAVLPYVGPERNPRFGVIHLTALVFFGQLPMLAKTTSDRLPPPDPERTEEAKQVVQEHVDDLRKTIGRLRKKLN